MNKTYKAAILAAVFPLTYSLSASADEYSLSLSLGAANQISSNEIGSGIQGSGLNVKAVTRKSSEPLGIVFSYTGTSDSAQYTISSAPLITADMDYKYRSFMVGPSYDLNDRATIYGLIGSSWARAKINSASVSLDDKGVAYGAGLQYRIYNDFLIDAHYENTTMGSTGDGTDSGTYSIGIGYIFR